MKKQTYLYGNTDFLGHRLLSCFPWIDMILDLDEKSYRDFLDGAGSRADLIAGLSEISPLADDALFVARAMTESEFVEFRLALIQERNAAATGETFGTMPDKFGALLIPAAFIQGSILGRKFRVALGAALCRLHDLGLLYAEA